MFKIFLPLSSGVKSNQGLQNKKIKIVIVPSDFFYFYFLVHRLLRFSLSLFLIVLDINQNTILFKLETAIL